MSVKNAQKKHNCCPKCGHSNRVFKPFADLKNYFKCADCDVFWKANRQRGGGRTK